MFGHNGDDDESNYRVFKWVLQYNQNFNFLIKYKVPLTTYYFFIYMYTMKGLFIGINYIDTEYELAGCINDVNTIAELYKKLYGLTNVMILTDDKVNGMPTKENIINGIKWLVTGNKVGEQLFFHYSGHGSYVRDTSGDENDGRDECIIPSDHDTNGYILDDYLESNLVRKIGSAYLFAVMDCCHSGTNLDLNYNYRSGSTVVKTSANPSQSTKLNVALLSGCTDIQTSADTFEKMGDKYMNCGALTWGLHNVLTTNPNASYLTLVNNTRKLLAKSRYTQIPQLSFNIKPLLSSVAIKGDAPIKTQKIQAIQKRRGGSYTVPKMTTNAPKRIIPPNKN